MRPQRSVVHGRTTAGEACLAHSESDKVKAAYNCAQFNDERKALLLAWAEYLSSTVSNVVPLRAVNA